MDRGWGFTFYFFLYIFLMKFFFRFIYVRDICINLKLVFKFLSFFRRVICDEMDLSFFMVGLYGMLFMFWLCDCNFSFVFIFRFVGESFI